MIAAPRARLLALGAAFGAYVVILALATMDVPADPASAWLALVLYVAAVAASLWPGWSGRMPLWLALLNLAVSVAITLLVTSQLDASAANGYATWHVAAVGLLALITLTRGRSLIAYITVATLVVLSIAWGGVVVLGSAGVIGSVTWVAVAQVSMSGFEKADRDVRQYARARRQAAEWEAEQEARISERVVRLARTSQTVAGMFRLIAQRDAELTAAERRECLVMEAGLRDEIRGRGLLNDSVRAVVADLRRRGATVSLFDPGELEYVAEEDRDRILGRVAAALTGVQSDHVVIRSLPADSEIAVTVVGVSTLNTGAIALGKQALGDRVELWLEIPRRERSDDATARVGT